MLKRAGRAALRLPLPSRWYWRLRYATGGSSGIGSIGRTAAFKAEILNEFVARNAIQSVVEFGCGDGLQLSLAAYPSYLGYDVSWHAIRSCRERFRGDDSKSFLLLRSYRAGQHDLAISLEVIFHLVEDGAFRQHMELLFSSASRFVIIYSSNFEDPRPAGQIRHRAFSRWIESHRTDWRLQQVIPNRYPIDGDWSHGKSFSDFYVYTRQLTSPANTAVF